MYNYSSLIHSLQFLTLLFSIVDGALDTLSIKGGWQQLGRELLTHFTGVGATRPISVRATIDPEKRTVTLNPCLQSWEELEAIIKRKVMKVMTADGYEVQDPTALSENDEVLVIVAEGNNQNENVV